MKIQTLNLDSEEIPEVDEFAPDLTLGFWKRQFVQKPTSKQRIYDWAFGVAMPLVCVAADPIVFSDGGLLASYRPFAYLLSSVSILVMAAWLLWGSRLEWLAAPLAGLFLVGGAVSLIVGLLLLPLSLIGMFFMIGFLGFTPLISSVIYFRNGVRALRVSRSFLEGRVVWQAAVLAAIFSTVVPYVINAQISHVVERIVVSDAATIRTEWAKLRYFGGLVDPAAISRSYNRDERNAERRNELAVIYKELTGKSIENSWY